MTNNFFVIEEVSAAPLEDSQPSKEEVVEGDPNLAICPVCKQRTLKIENGCHACINEACGYSKCDM